MDARINRVLEKIRANLAEGSNIPGGPIKKAPPLPPNPYYRSIRDQFFDVMDDCVNALRLRYDMTDREAFDHVAKAGDLCESKGELPPFPTDDMNDAQVARWVNAASYSDFKKKVMVNVAMEYTGK